MFLCLPSRASATLNLAVPIPPGARHTGKTQRYPRRTITISLLCRFSSTSSSGRTLPSLSALRLVLRWARFIPYQMAAEAISSLADVMKHPHDIGHCSWFDAEGVPVVRWIEIVSGQCVYGNLGAVSWIFGTNPPPPCFSGPLSRCLNISGYLSILSWLCAQLPQIISNYQNGSVDGISPTFLTNWFMVAPTSR